MIPLLLAAQHTQSQLVSSPEPLTAMYPSAFFNLFPSFPTNNRVFVAMPFSERFTMRWEFVIKVAIEETGLEPYRVDLSQTADSIPLKILDEIRTAKLIFGDITSDNGVRNANVMYELGIAHAIRRPEEVLVFRSDDERLPFDIAPIFADSYHPDGGPGSPGVAKQQVVTSIKRALAETDLTRHIAVQRIVDSLDVPSFEFLASSGITPFSVLPESRELGAMVSNVRQMAGFSRLLSHGVLQTSLPDFIQLLEISENKAAASKISYSFTTLGAAVAKEFGSRFYGRRSSMDALHEYLRVEVLRLQRQLSLSQTNTDHLKSMIARGCTIKQLREEAERLAKDPETREAP